MAGLLDDGREMNPKVSRTIIGNLLRTVCHRPSQISGFAGRYHKQLQELYEDSPEHEENYLSMGEAEDDWCALAQFINQAVCNSVMGSMHGRKVTVGEFIGDLQLLLNEESIRMLVEDPQNARTSEHIPVSMN